MIGSPEIADVLPMTDTTFYVQGKKVGTTNISVFDWERHLLAVIDLEVIPDTATLHSNIVASTGGENINVTSANGQVVLSGEASDAVGAARAVEVAKGLSPNAPVINAMKISPSQQVMLKVRILEVDRSAGRDLGVNWLAEIRTDSELRDPVPFRIRRPPHKPPSPPKPLTLRPPGLPMVAYLPAMSPA